jgi:hypothetical protein
MNFIFPDGSLLTLVAGAELEKIAHCDEFLAGRIRRAERIAAELHLANPGRHGRYRNNLDAGAWLVSSAGMSPPEANRTVLVITTPPGSLASAMAEREFIRAGFPAGGAR